MDIDVIGRIGNVRLAYRNCLSPLFEAIVNSMHAIDEAAGTKGQIDVFVERDKTQRSLTTDGEESVAAYPVSGFKVQDNGAGFNERNYVSFVTSDTTLKVARGGKGVGRLLWLKAFDHAEVDSVYGDNSCFRHRRFAFFLSKDGIENLTDGESGATLPSTTVRLVGMKAPYQHYCPKAAGTIARRIIEHFLEAFALKSCPTITLHDTEEKTVLNLNRLFTSEMRLDSQSQTFQIKNQSFRLNHVRLVAGRDAEHTLTFCAHGRAVRSECLTKTVPNLDTQLVDANSSKQFVYAGYISGKFLDERVIPDRTQFDISEDAPQLNLPGELSWQELVDAASSKAKAYLSPYTDPLAQAKRERIRQYVQNEAPQYRHLLKHKSELIDQIPTSLSNDKLDLELHRIDQIHDAELRTRYHKIMAEGEAKASSVGEQRKVYEQFLEDWNEAGMSKLARHVAHRKATLAFLERRLGLQTDGRYALEESIHEVIFPLRATSDDVRPDNMNLWILDEQLAYHYYLASDKPLNQMQEAVQVESADRPDIVIFNRPFAFVEGGATFGSVVIIEFKRPARDDFGEKEGKDPIRQVDDYVELIKSGKAKDRRGRPITVPPHTPFYAYIVCDITPTLRKQAEYAQLTPTPDSCGYFGYHRIGVYIEVVSYQKLVDDAKRRNAVLFDKLGLVSHDKSADEPA